MTVRDPAAFRRVRVIADGLGIGWSGGLDYSARSLRLLAEEQRTLSGVDLTEFERKAGLTTRETAQIFDVAPRTVASYRRSARLPCAIGSMLRSLRSVRILTRHLPCGLTAGTAGRSARIRHRPRPEPM